MPQLFNVVRCFSCSTFQVDQVKKAKKWTCKICGEKQSLIKVYGQGTGRECRQHVQRLNSLRQEFDEKEDELAVLSEEPLEKVEEEEDYYQEADNPLLINNPQGLKPLSNNDSSNLSSSSKWSKFLPEEVHSECFESEITENSSTQEFRTKENPSKTKQKSFTIPYQEKRKKPFSNGPTKDSFCFPTKKNRTDFEDSNAIGFSFELKSEKIPHEENNFKYQNLIKEHLNPDGDHFVALNTNQNLIKEPLNPDGDHFVALNTNQNLIKEPLNPEEEHFVALNTNQNLIKEPLNPEEEHFVALNTNQNLIKEPLNPEEEHFVALNTNQNLIKEPLNPEEEHFVALNTNQNLIKEPLNPEEEHFVALNTNQNLIKEPLNPDGDHFVALNTNQNLIKEPLNPDGEHFVALNTNQNFRIGRENNSKAQNLILKPLNPEQEHFAALNTNQNFPSANELKKSVSSSNDHCRNNRDCLPYFKKGTNYDRHSKSDLLDELSTDIWDTDFPKTKTFDSSEEKKNGQNLGKNIFEIDESEIDLDF